MFVRISSPEFRQSDGDARAKAPKLRQSPPRGRREGKGAKARREGDVAGEEGDRVEGGGEGRL